MGKKEPSIELSPNYGVNPTLPVCFFCNEETGEVALLGRIRQTDENGKTIRGTDLEAPKHMILNYEPCDKCKEKMKLGITLVGVEETAIDNRPPIQTMSDGTKFYPTGHWVVVSEDFISRKFDSDTAETILRERRALVPGFLIERLQNSIKDKGDNK